MQTVGGIDKVQAVVGEESAVERARITSYEDRGTPTMVFFVDLP